MMFSYLIYEQKHYWFYIITLLCSELRKYKKVYAIRPKYMYLLVTQSQILKTLTNLGMFFLGSTQAGADFVKELLTTSKIGLFHIIAE